MPLSDSDRSAPHLSSAEQLPAAEAPSEGPRYQDLGLLGTGGMGEVRAVHDLRLGRQVARKSPRDGVPGAVEALEREAALTAALEHPGIVPVYDAGHDAAGRPWYTMRLVRGRSLHAIIAETPSLPARLALLRPLLAALEAVAYAHDRGVAHCDLKTHNVLLGEHGEVQVVDWGLATSGSGGLSGGTPATMAPEQARGEAATQASDVWSLGMMLAELLTGTPAHTDLSGPALRARVASGQSPQLPEQGIPPALRAVVVRCLQPDPSDRYADASALAADLANFLDDRLVSAHDYTLSEHLRRLIARHRLAASIALTAAVAIGLIGTAAAWRVVAERDAARAAEQVAQSALERSDRSLASALVLAARTAAASGRRPEAEVLAAEALLLGESPEARGVLASYGASPRPERFPMDVPPCGGIRRTGPHGTLCLDRAALTVHPHTGPSWSVPIVAEDAAFAGSAVIATLRGNRAVVLDGATGAQTGAIPELATAHALSSGHTAAWQISGRDLIRIDADVPAARFLQPCGGEVVAAVSEAVDGQVWVVCGASGLRSVDPETGRVEDLPLNLLTTVRRIAAGPRGEVAVGTDQGQVVVLDDGGERFTTELGDAVADLWWTADGQYIVAVLFQGSPVVLRAGTGTHLGRLPANIGSVVAWSGPSGLVFDGPQGGRWQLDGLRPVVIGQGDGITGIVAG
ncbi:MAG: hypothetical protein ACI8S6_002474, partial [Myxococcota bacterium]